MPGTNLERMIKLADEVFATKNDPDQLDVTPAVIEQLFRIHPSTVSEFDDGNGPVAWVLLIPTTLELMKSFLECSITEKELFEQTNPGVAYEALYMCSALVLPEFRRKGIVKQLTIAAIENIRMQHALKALFVWPFSREGELASEELARLVSLPLHKRSAQH